MKHARSEYAICCSTDKGRKCVLAQVEELASAAGATIEMHEFNGPREIGLELCFGPYRCMMHFDGSERIDAFMGHWHVITESNARYPDTFWRVGSLNTFHYSKCTTIESDLPTFLERLRDGVKILAQQSAAVAA